MTPGRNVTLKESQFAQALRSSHWRLLLMWNPLIKFYSQRKKQQTLQSLLIVTLNMRLDSEAHCCFRINQITKQCETESSGWNMYETGHTMCRQQWCHPLKRFYWAHANIRERLLWPHEGWRMLRGFFHLGLRGSTSAPTHHFPSSCPDAPTLRSTGSYETCILIFPSTGRLLPFSGLQVWLFPSQFLLILCSVVRSADVHHNSLSGVWLFWPTVHSQSLFCLQWHTAEKRNFLHSTTTFDISP